MDWCNLLVPFNHLNYHIEFINSSWPLFTRDGSTYCHRYYSIGSHNLYRRWNYWMGIKRIGFYHWVVAWRLGILLEGNHLDNNHPILPMRIGDVSLHLQTSLAEHHIVQGGILVKGASSLAPCRWYMTAISKTGGALNLPARIRIMPVEDVITGVSLTPALSEEEGAIYNVAGQRLNKMQKGINIRNGKKVVLK